MMNATEQPGAAILWARQGRIEAGKGDLPDALRCFQRSLELDIDYLPAWVGLSLVFNRMRDRQRSDSCLEVARRILCRAGGEATA
jgi:tetratricopeptide (TPR) repeat protein